MEKEIGDGIVLRPYKWDDVGIFYEAVMSSIRRVSKWMDWCGADYTVDQAEKWIKSRLENSYRFDGERSYMLFDQCKNKCAGDCGYTRIDTKHRTANLAYWIADAYAGQGLMGKAALEVCRSAFREGSGKLKIERLEILMWHENEASRRVAESLGASLEGVLRERILLNGQRRDALCFSLLPGDLDAIHTQGRETQTEHSSFPLCDKGSSLYPYTL